MLIWHLNIKMKPWTEWLLVPSCLVHWPGAPGCTRWPGAHFAGPPVAVCACVWHIRVSPEPVSRLFWPELAVCSLLSSAAAPESGSQTSLIPTEPFLRRRGANHTHVVFQTVTYIHVSALDAAAIFSLRWSLTIVVYIILSGRSLLNAVTHYIEGLTIKSSCLIQIRVIKCLHFAIGVI